MIGATIIVERWSYNPEAKVSINRKGRKNFYRPSYWSIQRITDLVCKYQVCGMARLTPSTSGSIGWVAEISEVTQ